MEMKLEKVVRYRVSLTGSVPTTAASLMGLALFLRAVYYFGTDHLAGVGIGAAIFEIALPMLLWGCFAFLLRGIGLEQPEVYGMLAAVYCILLMILSFSSGNIFRCILAVLWYTAAAAAILGTTFGYISNEYIPMLAFGVPILYRILMFDLWDYLIPLKLVEFLPEASVLCGLAGIFYFSKCLKGEPVPKHPDKNAV